MVSKVRRFRLCGNSPHTRAGGGALVGFSCDPDDCARYGGYGCGANGKLMLLR